MDSSNMLDAALSYARLGWQVLPCRPGVKAPLTAHGCQDATTDEATIKAWWTRWPTANIAIACGPGSGIHVVDIDVDPAKDVDGWASLKEFPDLPITIRQDTPRGGAHFLFKAEKPPKNKNGLRNGIDIRSTGYYIMVPPSLHPNGKRYAWAPDMGPGEVELAEFPDYMRPPERTPLPWDRKPVKAVSTPASALPAETHDNPLVVERARAYLQECEPAVQGQAGHDKLLWAARALVVGFELDAGTAINMLWDDYNPRCVPPWDRSNAAECRDFERKVHEVEKTPGERPRGWLLVEYGQPSSDQVLTFGYQLINDLLAANATVDPSPAQSTEQSTGTQSRPMDAANRELARRICDTLSLDGAEMLATDPPPHEPVLSGLFDHAALVEIVGPSKSRKSFMTMCLALCLAAGRDFFGFAVPRPFSVLLADLELSPADLRRRLWRMGRALGIGPADVGDRLRVLPLAGQEGLQPTIEAAAVGADVVIVDPLFCLCEGGETIEDLRPPLRWLRRLAVGRDAALFVHHDGKGAAGDRDTRDRGSGSGITGRSVDARLTITPAAADPDNAVVLGFMCRSYATPEPRALRFNGDCFETCDLPAEPERSVDRRARATRPKVASFAPAAEKLLRERGPMSPSVFKSLLRDLGLSKNDCDVLTATLTGPDGPAVRWSSRTFPPEYFIGTRGQQQSSQSSREDRREDR